MSPLDASFLHIEDGVQHMHLGSVGILEGPAPGRDELLTALGGKLALVPRYRQKVRFVPLALGRPVWVDDPHFRLDYHVRRTALPAPGGQGELRDLVGRVMSQPLDRARPLWELWIAEGLDEGRWALISKTHHCMVDGVSATDLLSVILDDDRDPPRRPADPWRPDPEPSSAELVAAALAARATSPYEGARSVWAMARAPRRLGRQLSEVARGTASMAGLLRPSAASSLNGPIGPHRRWDWAQGRLADVKTIRAAHGGTINDVVLTVISRGFRDLLLERGEEVAGRVVRTLVPVSVRAPIDRGGYDNKVSAMYAELPVGIEDPVACLTAMHEQMQGLKESGQAVAGERLTALSGFAPPILLTLGARVGARLPQRAVNTVTTNVPGPQHPLYLTGRRALEVFPFVPIGGHVRVGIAIFSYDGGLNYGLTGDSEHAPDLDVLAHGIEAGIAELLATTPRRPVPASEALASAGPGAGTARAPAAR